MAVLAEYRDVGPPGYATTAGLRAFEVGQSIMDRKQRLRLDEQRQQMEQAKFIAHLPLLQAQTENEQASAAAAIANATIQTRNSARAAVESVTAQKEFNDASQYYAPRTYRVLEDGSLEDNPTEDKEAARATLEARLEMLRGMSVKYAYMKDLKDPGFSGFYETINKTLVQTNEALHADLKMDQLLEAQKMMTDRAITTRTIGADASRDVANTNKEARVEESSAKARYDAERIKNLENEADLVEADDPDLAAKLRARITKINAVPAAKGRRALPAAVAATLGLPAGDAAVTPPAARSKPATVQTPAGPRPIPKGTKTINIDGKDYPIAVDAKGNRVYYKDGDWFDLPSGR